MKEQVELLAPLRADFNWVLQPSGARIVSTQKYLSFFALFWFY
jgi:hypothetical protein